MVTPLLFAISRRSQRADFRGPDLEAARPRLESGAIETGASPREASGRSGSRDARVPAAGEIAENSTPRSRSPFNPAGTRLPPGSGPDFGRKWHGRHRA